MHRHSRWGKLVATLALVTFTAGGCGPGTKTKPGPKDPTGPEVALVAKRTAVDPKGLSATVEKGLAWLAQHQLPSGGWGQGDESPQMGNSMNELRDLPNVADTSVALLAFLRAGNTARTGKYQDVVDKGVAYVLAEIEESDADSLRVTDVTGTRVQMKIGAYVDTFAALMMLTEARGGMRDGVANARLDAALKKVVRKIEKNQRDNGSWDDNGWAPVLSQAMAAKGLNRAAQNGADVRKDVLERVEKQAQTQVDFSAGTFAADGAAGVGLYGAAASSAATRDSAETKRSKAAGMKAAQAKHQLMESPDVPTDAEVKAAETEARKAMMAADKTEDMLVGKLDEPSFIAGFGNNGGEEFLSYLLISETLVQKGGDQWLKWDQAITQLVGKVQNDDGSWTGHHCITGRTFCTATALLVLMGDRTPAPAVIAT
jgi:hypothetical protein